MTATPPGPRYRVHTAPDAPDVRLRGRRYAIPFEGVWQAARRLTAGGLRGWEVVGEDDREGVLEARIPGRLLRPAGVVQVQVSLDADGQTCVQLSAGSATGGRDLGASRRRVVGFLAALDHELARAHG